MSAYVFIDCQHTSDVLMGAALRWAEAKHSKVVLVGKLQHTIRLTPELAHFFGNACNVAGTQATDLVAYVTGVAAGLGATPINGGATAALYKLIETLPFANMLKPSVTTPASQGQLVLVSEDATLKPSSAVIIAATAAQLPKHSAPEQADLVKLAQTILSGSKKYTGSNK